MKQLTNNLLKMNFYGIDMAAVSKIEFAFSQKVNEAPLKEAVYPGDDTVLIDGNMVGVIWTPADTQKFKAGKPFYADTRITMSNTEYQPATSIIELKMEPTLFEE